MAADIYNIIFDSGIEKVLQGSSSTTLTHEITVSKNGNSNSSYGMYLKPVFKSGYELNSATGDGALENGIYNMQGGSDVTFTSKASAVRISVDLATAFPDKWAALDPGEHTLQIRAKNPGNYLDSDLSTAIDFYKTVPITVTATNCTAATGNPTEFPDVGGGDTILTFNKKTGYTLPETIVITGVAAQNIGYSWTVASDGQSAQLKILKALGDIAVTVNAVREVYNITTTLEHALAGTGNPTTVGYGLSATLTFTFPTGYEAPADVTVTGATKSWEAGTGTLTLTNATGPVTVTVVGVATTTTLDGGTYKWLDNANLTEWTQEINFASDDVSYNAMRYTGDGTAMTLQYKDADGEWTTVYNYNEDTSTGSWVNDAYKIVDLGTSAQTVTVIFKADFLANTTKLTQLATPQNVTADGTNVSWDEVENATSYAVLADGSEIGQVNTDYKVTFKKGDYSQPDYYSTDNGVTWISCHEKFGTERQFIVMAKQIKLKVKGDGSYGGSMWATIDSTGTEISVLNIRCSYNTSEVSPNYVLTENITVTASGFSD